MAAIYARLVEKGIKSVDEVPANLRDAVRELLGTVDNQDE